MRFSDRVAVDQRPNRLTEQLARLRRNGTPVIDLTVSNPTEVGLTWPEDRLQRAMSAADLGRYQPDSRGAERTRQAVVETIGRYTPDRLLLTASTSEAYALLLKLLCDPGDEVLVPRPSYPLFEHLVRFEGARAMPYPLRYAGCWMIDLAEVQRLITDRTRAVIVVSPNNPTGSFATAEELAALARLCGDGAALICDEVFREYPLDDRPVPPSVAEIDAHLAFGLGGLSKLVGLPQLKLSWIGLSGDPSACTAAMTRLELVADTYLSVSTPAQIAAPTLLGEGSSIRAAIAARVRSNRHLLARLIEDELPACTLLEADAGWCAVLRLPQSVDEEQLVLTCLREHHVLAHPGYFYDFDTAPHIVVSLLPTAETFEQGALNLLRRADCSGA